MSLRPRVNVNVGDSTVKMVLKIIVVFVVIGVILYFVFVYLLSSFVSGIIPDIGGAFNQFLQDIQTWLNSSNATTEAVVENVSGAWDGVVTWVHTYIQQPIYDGIQNISNWFNSWWPF